MNICVADRLTANLEWRDNGCYEWCGALNQHGYGVISFEGKKRLVHRVSWELSNGPIPPGMLVCHSCDNRKCCSGEHLFLGTQQDNTADKVAKGRQAKGEKCVNGLTKRRSQSTIDIVADYHSGIKTQKELAFEHGLSVSEISLIVRGKRRA